MLLSKILIFIPFLLQASVTENSAKLDRVNKLLQEAMILLREVKTSINEEKLLDPANFEIALNYIKEGKFKLAKPILVAFSKGEDEKAYKSLYWLGVCFLEEKNYEKALISFTDFVHKIENVEVQGSLEDMKKMAYKHLVKCYEYLYRPVDACAIVTKIEKDFASEASYCKQAYEHLKCSKYKSFKEDNLEQQSQKAEKVH